MYLCVHKRLQTSAGISSIIHKKKFDVILARLYRLEKSMRVLVTTELIEMGLVEKQSDGHFKVNPAPVDLENTSALYQRMGLF